MIIAVKLALASFLLSMTAGANPTSALAPTPRAPLASLVTVNDYPAQAMANGQSGSVRFRLDIGADGRVSMCTILRSTRSSILDATTCRLMRSRARFTPARDASGQALVGRFEDEITWTLPATAMMATTPAPRLYELIRIWSACVMGDAARRAVSSLDVNAIPDATYASCIELEPLLLAEMARVNRPNMVPADAMRQLKLQMRSLLATQVGAMRRNLATK